MVVLPQPFHFQKNHENKYARETTPEILKKAIAEWKCDKCDFQAKDEFELQEHKQEKKHFTDN